MIIKSIDETIIEKLAELFVLSFNGTPWFEHWTIKTASKRLHEFISCDSFYGIYIEEGNKIIGLLLGNQETDFDKLQFQIKEFCIHPDVQGRKLGSTLLKELEKHLKSRNISEIYLLTSRDERVQKFYRNQGFDNLEKMVPMSKKI